MIVLSPIWGTNVELEHTYSQLFTNAELKYRHRLISSAWCIVLGFTFHCQDDLHYQSLVPSAFINSSAISFIISSKPPRPSTSHHLTVCVRCQGCDLFRMIRPYCAGPV